MLSSFSIMLAFSLFCSMDFSSMDFWVDIFGIWSLRILVLLYFFTFALLKSRVFKTSYFKGYGLGIFGVCGSPFLPLLRVISSVFLMAEGFYIYVIFFLSTLTLFVGGLAVEFKLLGTDGAFLLKNAVTGS